MRFAALRVDVSPPFRADRNPLTCPAFRPALPGRMLGPYFGDTQNARERR